MSVSTAICIGIAIIIILASGDDIAELKAQQLAAKEALLKTRLQKQLYKEQKHGNDNN